MFRTLPYRTYLSYALVLLLTSMASIVYIALADETTDEEEEHAKQGSNTDILPAAHANEQQQFSESIFEELSRLESLLAKDDENEKRYSQERRCIEVSRMKHYDALNSRFVAFEMRSSDEFYLIQFETQCPGLEKYSRISFDLRGKSGRLCVNDSIQPLAADLSAQTAIRGSTCRVPSIQTVTEVQLIQLERGIDSNRVE